SWAVMTLCNCVQAVVSMLLEGTVGPQASSRSTPVRRRTSPSRSPAVLPPLRRSSPPSPSPPAPCAAPLPPAPPSRVPRRSVRRSPSPHPPPGPPPPPAGARRPGSRDMTRTIRRVLCVLPPLLVTVVAVRHRSVLAEGFAHLGQARWPWLLAAAGATCLTWPAAACTRQGAVL